MTVRMMGELRRGLPCGASQRDQAAGRHAELGASVAHAAAVDRPRRNEPGVQGDVCRKRPAAHDGVRPLTVPSDKLMREREVQREERKRQGEDCGTPARRSGTARRTGAARADRRQPTGGGRRDRNAVVQFASCDAPASAPVPSHASLSATGRRGVATNVRRLRSRRAGLLWVSPIRSCRSCTGARYRSAVPAFRILALTFSAPLAELRAHASACRMEPSAGVRHRVRGALCGKRRPERLAHSGVVDRRCGMGDARHRASAVTSGAWCAERRRMVSRDELAIIRTVIYASLFDYSPDARAVAPALISSRLTPEQIVAIYDAAPGCDRIVGCQDGFFFRSDDSSFVAERRRREAAQPGSSWPGTRGPCFAGSACSRSRG